MIIETSDAVIVGEESCIGESGTQWLTDEEGHTVEDTSGSHYGALFQDRLRSIYPEPNA